MKKLQISGKEFIRTDGLYCNLTDLFRLTKLAGIRLDPWGWAQSENRTRDISRRGWIFKKSWAKTVILVEYAHYLSHSLYRDVLRALDKDDPDKLIAMLGERKAARMDARVQELLDKRRDAKAEQARQTARALDAMREVKPKATPMPSSRRTQAEAMKRAMPTRSMSHSRSMGPSVSHHRSEPDYLTQAMVTQAVMNDWDSSPHRSHSSHSRHDDVCSTPSYSSHDSHSSSSWSGDSGGSYDSGSSGGCD